MYLKFDLSTFSGTMTKAQLAMQVASDPGNGTLEVFLATNSNWTENGLNGSNKPSTVGSAIGSISGTHSLGQTKIWELDVNRFSIGGAVTLIIKHSNGNDVAFASDETTNAPRLLISSKGTSPSSIAGFFAKSSSHLALSPNPASSKIDVTMSATAAETRLGAIYVYDVIGRLIQTIPASEVKSKSIFQMDVSSFPKGLYFVRTVDQNGVPYQEQMAIER